MNLSSEIYSQSLCGINNTNGIISFFLWLSNISLCVYMCVVYIYIYICVYVCVCIYIYI